MATILATMISTGLQALLPPPQAPEPDALYRDRLWEVATEDDKRVILLSGSHRLDAFGEKYGLRRIKPESSNDFIIPFMSMSDILFAPEKNLLSHWVSELDPEIFHDSNGRPIGIGHAGRMILKFRDDFYSVFYWDDRPDVIPA